MIYKYELHSENLFTEIQPWLKGLDQANRYTKKMQVLDRFSACPTDSIDEKWLKIWSKYFVKD